MPRRPDAINIIEDKLVYVAYGFEQFSIRDVSEPVAEEMQMSDREVYKIAQEFFKLRFEQGMLERVQEAGGHRPVIYRWIPE